MPGSVKLSNTWDQLDMLAGPNSLYSTRHICGPSRTILAGPACSTHIPGACGGPQLPVQAVGAVILPPVVRLAASACHLLRPCLPRSQATRLSLAAVQAAVLTHIGVPGFKKENQDTAFCQAHGFGGRTDCSLFGIFDGHGVGGMAISHHCSQLLPYFLSLALEEAQMVGPPTPPHQDLCSLQASYGTAHCRRGRDLAPGLPLQLVPPEPACLPYSLPA